jgi:uncharacterized SAM-binding protein YcdF (DUF218 family)
MVGAHTGLDRDTRQNSSRTALVVLGYHEFGADGSHGISAICRAGVRSAERIAARDDPCAVVFTGWSSTGGPPEAEQMRQLWRPAGPDLLVEPCARTTAENAAYSLRLLLDHGGIDRATIVCSIRHRIRVPFFFGDLFPANGLGVRYEFVWRPFPGAGIWLQEAGGLALMARHRRHANALFARLPTTA